MKQLLSAVFVVFVLLPLVAACAPGTSEPAMTAPADVTAPAELPSESLQLQPFVINLSGDTQAPPVSTLAFGTVTVSLLPTDDPLATPEAAATLSLSGGFQGLESDLIEVAGSSAHIHQAPRGETGPVVFPIEVGPNPDMRSGTLALTVNLTQDQLDSFMAGNYYINIHTEGNPAGELRGQLLPGG